MKSKLALLIFGALFGAIWNSTISRAQSGSIYIGMPQIIDGDTIDLNGVRIRLWGIDAFEAAQTCGQFACGNKATQEIAEIISNSKSMKVICIQKDTDRNGRIVAICRIDGIDIGAALVSKGLAVAYKKYSMDYVGEESLAKSEKAGAWRYEFKTPDEYRNGPQNKEETLNFETKAAALLVLPKPISPPSPLPQLKPQKSNPAVDIPSPKPAPKPAKRYVDEWGNACEVKGNINSKGEKIYHTPTSPSYEKTIPEEMFCTIEDAEDAGYRAAFNKEYKKATYYAPKPAKKKSAYYANCTAARAAGAAPIYAGEPGYAKKLDRDGDGIACEN